MASLFSNVACSFIASGIVRIVPSVYRRTRPAHLQAYDRLNLVPEAAALLFPDRTAQLTFSRDQDQRYTYFLRSCAFSDILPAIGTVLFSHCFPCIMLQVPPWRSRIMRKNCFRCRRCIKETPANFCQIFYNYLTLFVFYALFTPHPSVRSRSLRPASWVFFCYTRTLFFGGN